MATDKDPANAPAPFLSLPKLIGLLVLTIAATGAVMYFALRSKGASNESVVSVLDERAAPAAKVNTGEVLDATVPNSLAPELGRRYKVRVESESRDGASMIARIGRTVAFINDVKPGDVVVVEVTRTRSNTAEAIVLERISSGPPLSASAHAPRGGSYPRTPAAAQAGTGEIHTGTVVSVGKFGDGLVKLGRQQVYVPGVAKGDRIVFEITEKRENAWSAKLVELLGREAAGKNRESSAKQGQEQKPRRDAPATLRAPDVQAGKEYTVTVTEKERSKPDVDGVARVEGLAVLIPGCQPGDKLKIRIVERLPTLAKAEIIERLPAGPTP